VKPEAIVFDMYGTVANLDAVNKACVELVGDPTQFGSLWRLKQLEYTFLLSMMGDYRDFWQVTEAALQFTVDATGAQLTQGQQSSLMESWLRPEPFEDAVGCLKKLRGRYPLAILSNGGPRMLREGLKHAGLNSFFDEVLSVDEVKAFKPSPEVYDLAQQRLRVSKEKVFFVSSNSFDVVGSKKYGFHTCWIRRAVSPLDPLGQPPDHIVRNFEELARLVG